MAKPRLSRRTVLRGAGSIAIALPWLEAMEPVRAQTAPTTAQRFLAVYQPGGTVLEKWRPTGTEDAPVLGSILTPLAPILPKLLIVEGRPILHLEPVGEHTVDQPVDGGVVPPLSDRLHGTEDRASWRRRALMGIPLPPARTAWILFPEMTTVAGLSICPVRTFNMRAAWTKTV